MAIRITDIERVSYEVGEEHALPNGWKYTTDINAAHIFDVYDKYGNVLIEGCTGGEFEIESMAILPPYVAIDYYQDYLDPPSVGSLFAGNHTILQWLTTGANTYHVERYLDAEWISVAVVEGNSRYIQYAFNNSLKVDITQWRVIPCSGENDDGPIPCGAPVEINLIHVCIPDMPLTKNIVADSELTTTDIIPGDFENEF